MMLTSRINVVAFKWQSEHGGEKEKEKKERWGKRMREEEEKIERRGKKEN